MQYEGPFWDSLPRRLWSKDTFTIGKLMLVVLGNIKTTFILAVHLHNCSKFQNVEKN